ncbi:hypothetical protein [Comamonas sp. NoAH]|uniref:hypothetical protein n=1 Tax=Comamonas halotolerans TaxID=3041496 RepID=UPI0024E0421D|nr:hypothetical protein [Comamonas sp. NoAH]
MRQHKYFTDDAGTVYAYEADGSQDGYISPTLRAMTEEEIQAHLNPPPAVVAPPQQCTPAQGLVALFAIKGITEDQVLAAIEQIPDPVQRYTAKIGYQRATSWELKSPTMQFLAQLLQLSETDMDELFSYAVTVQV